MPDKNNNKKLKNIRDLMWDYCNTPEDYKVRRYANGYLNSCNTGWELDQIPNPDDYYTSEFTPIMRGGDFEYDPPHYSREELDYLERGLESFDIFDEDVDKSEK